jgi:hypothetical protein
MPVVYDDFGARPDMRKHEVISMLAPAYIEFGKFMRALFQREGVNIPVWYMNPLPMPIKPSELIIGMKPGANQFFVDLLGAEVVNEVPSSPILAIKVDPAHGYMFDAAPMSGRPGEGPRLESPV